MFGNIHLKQKYGLGYRVLCEPVDSFCGEYDKKNKSGSSPKNIRLPLSFLYALYKKVLNKSKFRELHIQEQGRLFWDTAFSCDKTLIKR